MFKKSRTFDWPQNNRLFSVIKSFFSCRYHTLWRKVLDQVAQIGYKLGKIHQFKYWEADFHFQNFTDVGGISFCNACTRNNKQLWRNIHRMQVKMIKDGKSLRVKMSLIKLFIWELPVFYSADNSQWLHVIQCTRIVKIETLKIRTKFWKLKSVCQFRCWCISVIT